VARGRPPPLRLTARSAVRTLQPNPAGNSSVATRFQALVWVWGVGPWATDHGGGVGASGAPSAWA